MSNTDVSLGVDGYCIQNPRQCQDFPDVEDISRRAVDVKGMEGKCVDVEDAKIL